LNNILDYESISAFIGRSVFLKERIAYSAEKDQFIQTSTSTNFICLFLVKKHLITHWILPIEYLLNG